MTATAEQAAGLTDQAADDASTRRLTLALWAGAIVYAVLLVLGNSLLIDPDIHWQVTLGQWMVDHRNVPFTDTFSLTMQGQPWRSSQWLSLTAYGQAYAWWGWAGPVILASLATAMAFALLAWFLLRRLGELPVLFLLMAALLIAHPHLFARPHVLALPVMVAWTGVLLSAAERRQSPPLLLAALMTLWVNIHGSFVFGLLLIGPIALDALVNAQPAARLRLALRWMAFGVAALVACCVTPYGWHSFLIARDILNLGEVLKLLLEWKPANFSSPGALEIGTLAAFALALFAGVKLPLVRMVLFVGLLYMALAHVRNMEIFATLAPMVVAMPLAAQFHLRPDDPGRRLPRLHRFAAPAAIVFMLAMSVSAIAYRPYVTSVHTTPAAAVAALKEHKAARVFNDYDLGGYLISQGITPYIDGRAELYGEAFVMQHSRARALWDPGDFFELLDKHKIDATLLRRKTPGAKLLDHVSGWRKIYFDDLVVVHVREPGARPTAEPEIQK